MENDENIYLNKLFFIRDDRYNWMKAIENASYFKLRETVLRLQREIANYKMDTPKPLPTPQKKVEIIDEEKLRKSIETVTNSIPDDLINFGIVCSLFLKFFFSQLYFFFKKKKKLNR